RNSLQSDKAMDRAAAGPALGLCRADFASDIWRHRRAGRQFDLETGLGRIVAPASATAGTPRAALTTSPSLLRRSNRLGPRTRRQRPVRGGRCLVRYYP